MSWISSAASSRVVQSRRSNEDGEQHARLNVKVVRREPERIATDSFWTALPEPALGSLTEPELLVALLQFAPISVQCSKTREPFHPKWYKIQHSFPPHTQP